MQFTRWITTVLAGGKNYQEPASVKGDIWQLPLRQVRRVVRQVPAIQVNAVVPCVEHLDPVRAVAVVVPQSVVIASGKLGDQQVGTE